MCNFSIVDTADVWDAGVISALVVAEAASTNKWSQSCQTAQMSVVRSEWMTVAWPKRGAGQLWGEADTVTGILSCMCCLDTRLSQHVTTFGFLNGMPLSQVERTSCQRDETLKPDWR